jgi:PAS domain S-box-containing protein
VWRDEQVNYEDQRISGAFEVAAFQIKRNEMAAMFWDITERRKSEEDMRRLMAALSAMGESVVITDSKGVIQYANPFFQKLTGYALGEIVGMHVRMLKSGVQDDAFYKRLWEILGRGETWTGNFVNRKKDGRLYHESASISPVRNAAGVVVSYVAVKRDMTREIDLERRVMRSQKMAALGQLAYRVGHDVTNGLSTILGSAEIIGKAVKDENLKQLVDTIVTAVDNVSGLTTSLMAFAHPGAINTSKITISGIISGMESMIVRACRPNVAVDLDIKERLLVNVDVSQIEQAIMHLVLNAAEAIEGQGTLHIEAKRGMMPARIALEDDSSEQEVPAAIVVLKDSGVGLSREECEKAFEPFFSTKRDRRRNAGLGLSTVYSIVARHNGDITIKSEKGKGAELRIALPLAE